MRLHSFIGRPLIRQHPILQQQRWFSKKAPAPLRILFCGSDEFSSASLKALHKEHACNKSLIESIDVVIRPPKPTGRGYKTIRQVPLQSVAEELSLPIHQRDTFTGWTPPVAPNLIIAVSFGLFVPRRILRAAEYGGLNLHPSLLPDLRGAAPLHWALLLGRRFTGVTLQTLSEKDFDRGDVLAKSGAIDIPSGCSVSELRDLLAPISAQMLVDSLQQGLHIPPRVPLLDGPTGRLRAVVEANKLTPLHRELFRPLGCEQEWDGVAAARRAQILGGRVWSRAVQPTGKAKRVIFHHVEAVPTHEWPADLALYMDNVMGKAGNPRRAGSRDFYTTAGVLDRNYWSKVDPDSEQRVVMLAMPDLAPVLDKIKPGPNNIRVWNDGQELDDGTYFDHALLRRSMLLLPYYSDPKNEDAVLVPVDAARGDVVRIRKITTEGEDSKPAQVALREFSLKLEEVRSKISHDTTVGNLVAAKMSFGDDSRWHYSVKRTSRKESADSPELVASF